jgi:hypothetical protein
MRRQLQLFLGGKYHFSATVGKFGLRYTPAGIRACMLLFDVGLHLDSGVVMSQHIWTEVSSKVAEFNPRRGDRICFDATVKEYYKLNSQGLDRLDYNASGLENLDLVTRPYDDGLAFSEYWGNVMQSHLFNRENEVPCTA